MKSNALETIETQLPHLSNDETLWLIDQLAKQLRKQPLPVAPESDLIARASDPLLQRERRREEWRASLDAMAKDPCIQAEIRKIEAEFSVAEEDGLEGL